MKKRIMAYWVGLLSLLLVISMLGTVGQTQARYQNTVSYSAVAAPVGDPVFSDCLWDIEDKPVTVVLGEQNFYQLSFTLTSRKDVSGTLRLQVNNPEFVTAQLQIGGSVITDSKIIGLSKGLPVTVTLTLQATQKALTQEREALPVYAQVTWENTLTGAFQLTLPAVAAQSQEIMEPEVEADPASQGEPETEPAEETEPSESTEPTEETEPSESTEPTEETEPSGSTEPTEETDPSTETESSTETEPEEPPVEESPVVTLETVANFAPVSTLPLLITAEAPTDSVLLGLGTANEALTPFPKYTCYSLDNGESYYMLYEPGLIPLTVTEGMPLGIVLDLSRASVPLVPDLNLGVYAYEGETLLGAGYAIAAPTIPQTYTLEDQILTEDGELVLTAPEAWKDYAVTAEAELLTIQKVDEQEYKTYTAFPFTEDGLIAEETLTEEGCWQLTLRLGEELPPAGTYRVRLTWHDGEMNFGHSEVFIFVNYTDQNEKQTGGAEQ